MYLNTYQKRLVGLVEEYGCLKRRQLEYMVNMYSERKLPNLDGYINQLCQFGGFQKVLHGNEIYVGYKGTEPDPVISDAFEVMMQFAPNILSHSRGRSPAAICFLVQAKEQKKEVRVIPVPPGEESVICAFAEDSAVSDKSRLDIFLLCQKEQMRKMIPKCRYKFALVGGDKVSFFER